MTLARFVFPLAIAFLFGSAPLRAESAAPATCVAIPPAILQTQPGSRDTGEKEGTPLAERVQLALQADPAPGCRFVERTALDTVLREQRLALSGAIGDASAIRAGRLQHADWILRLRLRSDDLQRPRIEAEVIDALRADLLARAEFPLTEPPNESWLLLPDDAHAELVRATAERALQAARKRAASLAGRPIVAPLVFVNRSGTERLAPLGPALQAALRAGRPGVRVLGYDSPSGAVAESALFLAGMTDLPSAGWAHVADVFVWGEYTEAGSFDGPAADLPVSVRLHVWREGSAPVVLDRQGVLGRIQELARTGADAILEAAEATEVAGPGESGETREKIARRLLASAQEAEAAAREATLPRVGESRRLAASQILSLALFFDPASPDLQQAWRDLLLRLSPAARLSPAVLALGRALPSPASPSPVAPPAPSVPPAASAPPAPRPAVPAPSVFTAWEDAPLDELLRAAEAGPLARTGSFALPWMDFSPWDLVAGEPYDPRPTADPVVLLLTSDSLWVAPLSEFHSGEAARRGVRRLDLRSHQALRPPLEGLAEVQVSGMLSRPDGLWFATRGNGVRTYDTDSGRARTIGAGQGLPDDDPRWLLDGRDAVFVVARDLSDPRVSRVDPASGRVDQALPPPEAFLPGLIPAARAAIASFGDDSARLVSLPEKPAIVFEHPELARARRNPPRPVAPDQGSRRDWRRPSEPSSPRGDDDPSLARCQVPTGVRDGYWVASDHSVIWAAGERRIPLAHWVDGYVAGLADDGRCLFIQISRRSSPHGLWPRPAGTTFTPDDLRTYVYDHQAGKWLGHFFLPGLGGMNAAPGLLVVSTWEKQPLLIADTSSLYPVPARPALSGTLPDTGTSPPGWSPLLAALWTKEPGAVRELLRKGASPDAADARGWSPLMLAAGWSSPACLEALLQNATFDRPALDLALRAAALRQRADIQRLLLAAGATPLVTETKPEAAPQAPRRFREPATPTQTLADLINAPGEPDKAMLKAALEAGADPCEGNPGFPLLTAARKKKFSVFEAMLPFARPEGLNRLAFGGAPAGLLAMESVLKAKRPDLAQRLLAAGTRPMPGKWEQFLDLPLGWLAILSGDAGLVRILLDAGFAPSDSIQEHPLREAVAQKNAPLLVALLAARPKSPDVLDVNNSSGEGRSALFDAADIGWVEGVKLLLAAGADPDTCDSLNHRHARDAAAPWPEVSVLLNRRPGAPDNQPAGAAAVAALYRGDATALEAVAVSADVLRYRDFLDWTVLHHAARKGCAGFLRRLIVAGAATDPLTSAGESALCLAAAQGDLACVETLLRAGAAPDRRRGSAWLPLHVAARAGRPDLVRALLAAGADPRLRAGEEDRTALFFAAMAPGETEAMRLLVEAGASLDVTDSQGLGVLEAAVLSDSPGKIQYLLDRGARWKMRFSEDYHPMDVAAARGLTGSIRKLRELGLQSPRALSLAKDDTTRALLQDDRSEAGRRFLADEERWPAILSDPLRWRERAEAYLQAGGDVNHPAARWRPLDLALAQNDPERVAFLIARGADPAHRSRGLSAADGRQATATALYWWLSSQCYLKRKDGPPPAGRDEVAVAYLKIFWDHDLEPELRQDMIQWAGEAGFTQAVAWMQNHR